MKPSHSKGSIRAKAKEHNRPKSSELAVHRCEEAAAQMKLAGEELAACWTALTIEISNGASPTDLLRRRAWCNVLELRLREKAAALEAARRDLDSVWKHVLNRARTHDLAHRSQQDTVAENLFAQSWTLLLQPKTSPAMNVVEPAL
jgi:hypothetical protein